MQRRLRTCPAVSRLATGDPRIGVAAGELRDAMCDLRASAFTVDATAPIPRHRMGKTPVKLDALLSECAEKVEVVPGRGIVTRKFAGQSPSRTIGLVWRQSSLVSDAFDELCSTMSKK